MDLTNDNNKENENNSISSDLIRGHINTIILRTLYDGDKYGYEIINEIEEKSKGQYSLKQPTLYSALKRLEGQDYVTSYWGGVSNGGRRKYFQITDKGKKIVEQNLAEWEYSRTVIDSLISQKDYDFSNPPPSAVDFNILKKSTTRVPLSKGEVGKDDEVELGFDFSENSDTDNENEDFEKNYSFEDKAEEHGATDKIDDDSGIHETAAQETAFREERLMREEIASETAEQPAQSAVDDSEETRQEVTYSVQTEENNPPLSEEEKQRIHENYKKLVGDDEDASNYYYAQVANRNKQERIIETNNFIAEETVSADVDYPPEPDYAADESLSPQVSEYDEDYMEKRAISSELLYSNRSPAERNYKSLLSKLYDNADKQHPEETFAPEPEPGQEEPAYDAPPQTFEEPREETPPVPPVPPVQQEPVHAGTAASNIEFYDIEEKAETDGIRVTTSNGTRTRKAQSSAGNTFDKGKALFMTAIYVFIIALAECIINWCLVKVLDSSALYIIIPFLLTFIMFGIFLFLYLRGYGKNSRKSQTNSYISSSLILYANLVLVICLIAYILIYATRVDVSFAVIAKYAILPCIFAFNIPLFALFYHYHCNKM